MSGDTKTKSRKRKRNDQVERFNESHLALQRAMEKDYRTGKQARRSEESERASAQRAEEKDANAARLAALLDAARRQEEKSSTDSERSQAAKKAPSIDRALAAPASYISEDVHAARTRATHPVTGAAPVADPAMPPPLVDRDLDSSKTSTGKVVLRLLVVAILFGAAIYALVTPDSEGDAVSAMDKPGVVADAVPAPATPVPETEPASAMGTATAVALPSATAEPAVPATATMEPPAKPATPASTSPVVKASSPLLPAPSPDANGDTAEAASVEDTPADKARPDETASAPKPALRKAAADSGATPVAVSLRPARRDADIPPPPPPPPSPVAQSAGDVAPAEANTPEKAKPDLTIGEETLRALSLIGPDATSIDAAEAHKVVPDRSRPNYPPAAPVDTAVSRRTADTAVSSDTASVKPASARRPFVERRPYFQRLGPTPPPNPFRADELQPAPKSFEPDIPNSYFDIE